MQGSFCECAPPMRDDVTLWFLHYNVLSHWMGAFTKRSLLMAEISLLKLPSDKCHWTLQKRSQHWFRFRDYLSQCWPRSLLSYGITRPLDLGQVPGSIPCRCVCSVRLLVAQGHSKLGVSSCILPREFRWISRWIYGFYGPNDQGW